MEVAEAETWLYFIAVGLCVALLIIEYRLRREEDEEDEDDALSRTLDATAADLDTYDDATLAAANRAARRLRGQEAAKKPA